MEYGPSGSHGHPSKLGIDLFADDEPLLPFPGVIFPYNDPLDPAWYWTTLANCALTVDEKDQVTWGTLWRFPRGTPNPAAEQLVFAPAATMGLERARSDNLYAARILEDRSLFLTAEYLADLFAAGGDAPHRYDLAWHLRGKLDTDLQLEDYRFPEPVANGYNALHEVRRASTDKAWSARIATPLGHARRLLAAGGTTTGILVGKGHFFLRTPREDEAPPTIIERREGATSVLFGTAVDLSGTACIRSIGQEGGLEAGYALLRLETLRGVDLCFASYRHAPRTVAGLETDALQALVRHDGAQVIALYCAGGTFLKADGAMIARSTPGLALVERSAPGRFLIANPGPAAATVTVRLPALAGMTLFLLDGDGRRSGRSGMPLADGVATLELAPGARAEAVARP